jgi:hypothetical protein
MNLTILHRKFNNQDKCIAYLEKLRCVNTPAYIHCGSTNVTHREGSIKCHCNEENNDFSVMVGFLISHDNSFSCVYNYFIIKLLS